MIHRGQIGAGSSRNAAAMILYLEQDERARAVVTSTLRRMGHTVVEASTKEEGLAHAARPGFDLFLLSISLLDGWGADFCCQARERDRTIPVFFFSVEFVTIHRVDAAVPESVHPRSVKELRHNIARMIGKQPKRADRLS